MKRRYENIKVEGRVQNVNPFKEIDGKTFNKVLPETEQYSEKCERRDEEAQRILGDLQQHQRPDRTEKGIQQQHRQRTILPS